MKQFLRKQKERGREEEGEEILRCRATVLKYIQFFPSSPPHSLLVMYKKYPQ